MKKNSEVLTTVKTSSNTLIHIMRNESTADKSARKKECLEKNNIVAENP